MRAVVALSGLLGVVVLAALLINLFSDDDSGSTTTLTGDTTSTTSGVVDAPGVIQIIQATCTPPGLEGAFGCSNLIDETDDEFQIDWNELPANAKTVEIYLEFAEPMVVQRIDWTNIADTDRFRRNYRAKGLRIEAEGNPVPFPYELQDEPGPVPQQVGFATIRSNWVKIIITSEYAAEVVNDSEPFDELAISEITVIGYRFVDTAAPDETTTTPPAG